MAVIVFGGNGFVGTNCLKILRSRSIKAVSVSRQGKVPKHLESSPWASEVLWHKGDALQPDSYAELLTGAHAIIVAVGSPPVPTSDVAWQIKMNGGANLT